MKFPFYEKARALWQKTQDRQVAKGLEKYPEPFNPHSWTSTELLDHALEESVDLVHYLVGLKDKLDKLEQENQRLAKQVEAYERMTGKRVLLTSSAIPAKSPFEETALNILIQETEERLGKKPPYADLDD